MCLWGIYCDDLTPDTNKTAFVIPCLEYLLDDVESLFCFWHSVVFGVKLTRTELGINYLNTVCLLFFLVHNNARLYKLNMLYHTDSRDVFMNHSWLATKQLFPLRRTVDVTGEGYIDYVV